MAARYQIRTMRRDELTFAVDLAAHEGWKIGPLFADHRSIAEPLLLALCRGIADDEPVYLDVPEVNTEAVRLADDLGMHDERTRLYA